MDNQAEKASWEAALQNAGFYLKGISLSDEQEAAAVYETAGIGATEFAKKSRFRVFLDEKQQPRSELQQPQEQQNESVTQLTRNLRDVSLKEQSSMTMPDLFVPTANNKPRDMLLTRLESLEKQNTKLALFLAIVQSSGYGKTRTLLEVAKMRPTVYLLCSNIKGGLQSPAVVSNFVKEVTAAETTEFRERRAAKFLQCVVNCAKPYRTAAELFDAQFTDEAFGDFYTCLENAVGNATIPPTSNIRIETAEASPKSSSLKRLVVVFDEAFCLTEHEEHNRNSPYRCIRRILKCLDLIGVFLDTSGKVHMLVPEGAPSDREAGIGIFPPPIFEIDTFDEFRNGEENPFFFGRPLWWMQWEYRLDRDYGRLVEFACHKLSAHGKLHK